jgi:hypothetical protein
MSARLELTRVEPLLEQLALPANIRLVTDSGKYSSLLQYDENIAAKHFIVQAPESLFA